MDEMESLRARLNAIDSKIEQARNQLKLKGLFNKDHEATADELKQRYKLLDEQLKNEVDSIEAQGGHVDSFEKTVLMWMNRFNFDH